MRIRKIGVVGAGAMGAGIAALAASAGVPVVLLDIPGPADRGPQDRSAPARDGLQKAVKAKPAAFMHSDRAALVRTGNIEDDLALLADCDWVIEAIVEKPGPKQALYEKLEDLLRPDAVVSSNTSGIPMSVLLSDRSERFRAQFLGTHFFNPPRYMHLLEIIPTPETAPAVLSRVRDFAERVLGKGVVVAKDAPGFIANRIGVAGMIRTVRLMEKHGLGIDDVDTLTGPFLGRPKTATFRTGDLSGLDVLTYVAAGLAQATGEDFAVSAWVTDLVKDGALGDKAKRGFYKKEGKDITVYDWQTRSYRATRKIANPSYEVMSKLKLPERLARIGELTGPEGAFLRDLLAETSHYVLTTSPALAHDLVAVDRAMEWGYGWDYGPVRVMDMLGLDWLRAEFAARGLAAPALLSSARESFYVPRGGISQALGVDGAYADFPHVPGSLWLEPLRREPTLVRKFDGANLIHLGDGVLNVEFKGKMNTLGQGPVEAINHALDLAERGDFVGVTLANDDPRTFTAGADLLGVLMLVQTADWKTLDQAIHTFQQTAMRLRYSPVPTVSAPFGLTLGGGCEYSMHCDRIQAHAELYMGLVEVGVGVIPGGGGTKELALRFTDELAQYEEADGFEGLKRAFKLIALAQTSTSALEAQAMGFLRRGDRITMNRDRLVADAKSRVLDLASDYVAPVPRRIRALGAEAFGNLQYALWAAAEGGQATPHDLVVGRHVAYVLCGGDGPARTVTEQDLLDLEREAFLTLLGTSATQERIAHMLKTGKPLRN
jgi:3-hydroxyacyl-CoA dehydrogenase